MPYLSACTLALHSLVSLTTRDNSQIAVQQHSKIYWLSNPVMLCYAYSNVMSIILASYCECDPDVIIIVFY